MIERILVGAIGSNCWIVPADPDEGEAQTQDGGKGSTSVVVVDPGGDGERIIRFLEDRHFEPVLIALTHGHLDHTSAVPELVAAARAKGRELPIAIHSRDACWLGQKGEETNRALFAAIGASEFFSALWAPLPEADILVEGGQTLPGAGWVVIHTPGHTAGSICLYHAGQGFLISGDTLFRDGVGRTDGPDSDGAALRQSIAGTLFSLPPETRVFPGHGGPTTIGRERGD
jgi:glyoxylase-like metal-dependent hydrolase (beta-lactamase superfamily II)